MEDRDKIAYLQELAASHFNDGNLTAAMAAWQQVLDVDQRNEEARKGMDLAQRKLAVAEEIARHEASVADEGPFGSGASPAPGAGYDVDATVTFSPQEPAFDPESTMMMGPGAAAARPPAPPPPLDGGFDPNSTLMFQPRPGAPPPAPAAGGFDGDRTMLVPPAAGAAPRAAPEPAFDADSTMLFTGSEPQAPAPPPAAGPFDGESTMLFTPKPSPPAPPPPGGFDADRTMAFTSAPPPPAPAASWSVPAPTPPPEEDDRTIMSDDVMPPPAASLAPTGAEEADATMLSPDDMDGMGLPPPTPAAPTFTLPPPPVAAPPAPDFSLPPPTAAAPPPAPPPAPAAPSFAPPPASADPGRELEDFDLPAGGLEMAGLPPPAGAPDFSLPPPPSSKSSGASPPAGGAGGFSFELPPPPGPAGAGAFDLPELPSVGLPPPPPPAPPPPPPPAARPAARSSTFGEVDAGELEGLAVPTVGMPAPPEAPTEDAAVREARLKEEYAKQFGKSAPTSSVPMPASAATPATAVNWKLLGLLVLVFAVLAGVGYVVMLKVIGGGDTTEPQAVLPQHKVPERTPEEHRTDMLAAVQRASEAMAAGRLDVAVKDVAAAREAASKAGLVDPPELLAITQSLEFEQGWQDKFDRAVRLFCQQDWASSKKLFDELGQAKPADPRPGEYVRRIFYNAGVLELQGGRPWEAVYYFEQVLQRDPDDLEARRRLDFAKRFRPGSRLGYQYTRVVDELGYRRAGCN